MDTFRNLNINLMRCVFQFLKTEEMIRLGFLCQRFRHVLNLSKEFIKPFLFLLRTDYRKRFLMDINKYMIYIKKNFPEIDAKTTVNFMAFYIKYSNAKNKWILIPINSENIKTISFICDSLNSKDSFVDLSYKQILFKIKFLDQESLEIDSYGLTYLSHEYIENKNYSLSVNVCKVPIEDLIKIRDFSKFNNISYKKLICKYQADNKDILNEILLLNPDCNVKLVIEFLGVNFNESFNNINKFQRVELIYDECKHGNFENFKNYVLKINSNVEISFNCKFYSEEVLEEFYDLVSNQLSNKLRIKLIICDKIALEYFNLTYFTTPNIKKIEVFVEHFNWKNEIEYSLRLNRNLRLNICNKYCLIGAKSIIERNIFENNDDYFKDFSLCGNTISIIKFCSFMSEEMSEENFRLFFSKISHLTIVRNNTEFLFDLEVSKMHVSKCFRHMINLTTLDLSFSPELVKYLDLCQFNLLTSLKDFEYYIPKGLQTHLKFIDQIKNLNLKFLRAFSKMLNNELNIISTDLKSLVRFTANTFSKKYKIDENALISLIGNNKNLNEIIMYSSSIPEEIKQTYNHITFER